MVGNIADKLRLDVSGVGVWGTYEEIFLDIRIMHLNSQFYINKPLHQAYVLHENEKKRADGERVVLVETASLTPYYQHMEGVVKKLSVTFLEDCATDSWKKNENCTEVNSHIRTCLSQYPDSGQRSERKVEKCEFYIVNSI